MKLQLTMRDRIGLAAFLLLICAAVEFVCRSYGLVESLKPYSGGTIRTGVVLFGLWLAWADLEMFPRWILIASVPTALLVAIYPKLLFVVIPLILMLLFLQPKKPKSLSSKKPYESKTQIQVRPQLPVPRQSQASGKRSHSLSRKMGKLTRTIFFRNGSQRRDS